ncbi:MAG: T9SS type A sorting domain-containing protein [Chitinophagaceae bacterium]|nr:T9SS type A sorting domain-containing protein [Chitinophagaceae bacterium]
MGLNLTKLILFAAAICLGLFSSEYLSAQHVTISMSNCAVISNSEVQFDVNVLNDGTVPLKFNSMVLRFEHSAGIYTAPTTFSWGMVAGSQQASWPQNAGFNFPGNLATMLWGYTVSNRQCSKSVSSPTFFTNANAPSLPIGTNVKIGRFYLKTTNGHFTMNNLLSLTWASTAGLVVWAGTSTITSSLNTNTTRSLITPCSFFIPYPLPVSLKEFSGKQVGETDQLNWVSAKEENTAYYNLQYSTDATNFTTIAKVNSLAQTGSSTVDLAYQYVYEHPVVGHNYYRLEEVDLDGQPHLISKVLDIEHMPLQHEVSIFPNPADKLVHVNFYAEKESRGMIQLKDLNGRKLKEISFTSNAGLNSIEVDLDEIASGMYVLQLFNQSRLLQNVSLLKEKK